MSIDIAGRLEICEYDAFDIRALVQRKWGKQLYCKVPAMIIIPSILYIDNAALRGPFTATQRFQQTLEQLQSLQMYFPNACVILVEMSRQAPDHQLHALAAHADAVVTMSHMRHRGPIHYMTKTSGEMYVMMRMLEKVMVEPRIQRVLKFGGRWKCRPSFDARQLLDHAGPVWWRWGADEVNAPMYCILFRDVRAFHAHLYRTFRASCTRSMESILREYAHAHPLSKFSTDLHITGYVSGLASEYDRWVTDVEALNVTDNEREKIGVTQ